MTDIKEITAHDYFLDNHSEGLAKALDGNYFEMLGVMEGYAKHKTDSLRMAVLEYFNAEVKDFEFEFDLNIYDLALSAGIHFENGTWILKEGEGE